MCRHVYRHVCRHVIHVQVVDSRVFSVNLHTGATIDWYVGIVVTSGGPRWRHDFLLRIWKLLDIVLNYHPFNTR